MRLLNILFIFAVATPVVCVGGEATPKKESVSFDGHVLLLASSGENPSERVKEFLPEGEKLQSWSKLASIREYPKLDDPKAIAANLLRALKQQNPQAPSSMIQNPKTGDVIVDFVTWPSDESFVEFNIFKYSKSKSGGLRSEQFAIRQYSDTAAFLKELGPLRTRLVDLMAKSGFQVP